MDDHYKHERNNNLLNNAQISLFNLDDLDNKKIDDEMRTVVPQYINDYVPLQQFAA